MARLQQRARLAIALAVGLACGAAAWPDAGDQTGHAKLWSWMETKGAFQVSSAKPINERAALGADPGLPGGSPIPGVSGAACKRPPRCLCCRRRCRRRRRRRRSRPPPPVSPLLARPLPPSSPDRLLHQEALRDVPSGRLRQRADRGGRHHVSERAPGHRAARACRGRDAHTMFGWLAACPLLLCAQPEDPL